MWVKFNALGIQINKFLKYFCVDGKSNLRFSYYQQKKLLNKNKLKDFHSINEGSEL